MSAPATLADRLAAALRSAPPMDLPVELVDDHIASGSAVAARAEAQFSTAFRSGLGAVPRAERHGGLNGVTGHVAESIAETMLVDAGWTPLEHFAGPFSGGHGIDLAMACPDFGHIFAVEVKGTLQARRWPALTRGELDQMSPEWLGLADNHGMWSLGAGGEDVSGLVIAIQFARRQWKAIVTEDFRVVEAISDADQLAEL